MKKVCSRCGKMIKFSENCKCKPNTTKKPNKDDQIYTYKWKQKRLSILKRDSYLCQRCFIKYKIINYENLTVHHIISRNTNPDLMYEDSNLICLCSTCNSQLGTKDKLDFDWKIKEEIDDVTI